MHIVGHAAYHPFYIHMDGIWMEGRSSSGVLLRTRMTNMA